MLFRRAVGLSFVVSALLVLPISTVALAAPPRPVGPAASSSATYIVQFTQGTNARAEAALAAAAGLRVERHLTNALTGMVADLTPGQVRALARNPRVALIEADGPVEAWATQSDPTWGLDRVDQRTLPLSGSYSYGPTGQGVTAYVIDSGVLASHSDFGGRVVGGYTVISDGNGTSDCAGHGTHVAGTLAGSTWGVAKEATIVPVRVLNCSGSGTWSGVIAGIDWVIGHHAAGQPAVANLSLGGGALSTVDTAIRNLVNDGVTVAVAAGNSSANACYYSPAREPLALTVAATRSSDARASFSNYGTCVDLFAPGESIRSAWPTSTTASTLMSGTSTASPHVAGAAALVLSASPGLTPAQVAAQVVSDATTGVVSSAGIGSPNRLLFTNPVLAPTAPSAPANVTAAAGVESATVTWTQGSNGGSPLTGQTVDVYEDTSPNASRTENVSASATSTTIAGLTAGTSYRFTVSATNTIGRSERSDFSNSVVPSPRPAAPVSTGWRPPAANAPVTSGSGDNNGFETNPSSAYSSDNNRAVDKNSGTSTSSSYTHSGKDRHVFSAFGLGVPAGASVLGIGVQLEASVDSTSGSPRMYVELSSDGGTTWTTAKATRTLSRSDSVYTLGGASDLWGRTWTGAEASDANFRVRITNVATSTRRDFSLDALAVDVTYQ